jgi:PAS domain-containing protein
MAHAHAYVTSEASWPPAAGGKLMPPAGAVIVADGAGDIVLVNPATERLLGQTANKLIGSRLTDRLRRADGSAWSDQDWPVPQPLGSRRCTPAVPMLAIRGDLTLPVAVVTMPLPSAQHGPHRMVVSILETAKPRKPGRRPRQARRWPEEPMAVAGRWDWQLDGHGRATAVSWNDEMYRLVGLAPRSAPINGERYLRTIHPDDQARVYEVGQHAFTMGGDVDHVHRVVLPTGQVRYLHITGTTELGAHGRPVRAWGTARISHSPSAQPHRTETAPASARFPIWIATRILPTAQRPRYIEEFNAELAEQPRRQRTPYALRLIGRSLALQRSLRTTHPRPEDRQ